MDFQALAEHQTARPGQIAAKIKALAPLISMDPSVAVTISHVTPTRLRVLAADAYLPKTIVLIIALHRAFNGRVTRCVTAGDRYVVEIDPFEWQEND